MIEFRFLDDDLSDIACEPTLQYRTRRGALCGLGEFSQWTSVQTVKLSEIASATTPAMNWRPASELPPLTRSINMMVSADVILWMCGGYSQIGFCRQLDDGTVQWALNRGVLTERTVTHWCEIVPPTEGPTQ